MTSTYALPVSLPHSHMHSPAHPHSQSHSLSPSKLGPGIQKASDPKLLKLERSNGTLHSQVHSSSVHGHSHSHSHSHKNGSTTSIDSHTSQYNGTIQGQHALNNHIHGHSTSESSHASDAETPSLQAYEHHDHSHDDHHDDNNEHHQHSHDHSHDLHSSNHSRKTPEPRSRITSFLLEQVDGSPLLHSILVEKDSRRIFYFMILNFAFMAVQAFYGFVTDSLGLLSDSIHMFFDCLALALGLFAAVASKWPPNERFPYGLGKIESLSGFGNGVFLMLISVEIMIEAAERIFDGRETKRLTELFVVSSLGLLVNLTGMACFGHHHHGHDHSHGGHDHCYNGHTHDHKHDHRNSHDHGHDAPALTVQAPTMGHGHDHENENMRGIYLHVLADTMGSAAVIVSTLLMSTIGWAGWDPLASIFIAVLIFLSSMPLVSSCAKKLLLTVPDNTEYQLRITLAGISGLRGVASYHVPRFWMADKSGEGEANSVLGIMHIIATRGTDVDDLRDRARSFLSSSGIDAVIQVEREGDGKCWCGGDSGRTSSPPTSRYS